LPHVQQVLTADMQQWMDGWTDNLKTLSVIGVVEQALDSD